MITKEKITNIFLNRVSQLELTRLKAEKLFKDNTICGRDIEQIYKGLFIDIVSEFENSLEDIFLGYLYGDFKVNNTRNRPKIIPYSKKKIREQILGPKNKNGYITWLPYKYYTIPLAKIYFPGGYPFTAVFYSQSSINGNDINNAKSSFKKITTIRNALAHKSANALSKFNSIIEDEPLLPREKNPSAYLRNIFRHSPNQTRYEDYVLEMSSLLNRFLKI